MVAVPYVASTPHSEPPYFVIFDFLGKDSIRYYKKVIVDERVFKNVKIFKRDKQDSDGSFGSTT